MNEPSIDIEVSPGNDIHDHPINVMSRFLQWLAVKASIIYRYEFRGGPWGGLALRNHELSDITMADEELVADTDLTTLLGCSRHLCSSNIVNDIICVLQSKEKTLGSAWSKNEMYRDCYLILLFDSSILFGLDFSVFREVRHDICECLYSPFSLSLWTEQSNARSDTKWGYTISCKSALYGSDSRFPSHIYKVKLVCPQEKAAALLVDFIASSLREMNVARAKIQLSPDEGYEVAPVFLSIDQCVNNN